MKIQIAAAATGMLLAMTACSSSTSGSGTGVTTPSSAAASSAAAGSSTVAGSSAPATSAAAPTGVGGKDASAWCGEVEATGPAVISAGDPSKLPPNWQAKAEQLAADAPSEIRSDVQTLISGDEKIINGDAGADSTPDFLKAAQHVVTWLGTNCPGLMHKLNPELSLPPTG